MSGYNQEFAERGLPARVSENFLPKPFNADQLFRAVRASLDARASQWPFPAAGLLKAGVAPAATMGSADPSKPL